MMSKESLLSALRRPDIESVMLTSEDNCFCLPADKTLSLHYIYYKVPITSNTKSLLYVTQSLYSMYYKVNIPCITKSIFHVLQSLHCMMYYKGYIPHITKDILHVIQSPICISYKVCIVWIHVIKITFTCIINSISCVTTSVLHVLQLETILNVLQSPYYKYYKVLITSIKFI